jgi:urease accessory protein UreE
VNRPKHMDPEDDFNPVSITVDELIEKLHRVRAAHGNVEIFALKDGDYISFDGILVDNRTYPHIAVMNNRKAA